MAFLAVSLVASNLSSIARARRDEALARRDEVARLFDLSRDIFLLTDSDEAITPLANLIARGLRWTTSPSACRTATSGAWPRRGSLMLTLDRAQLGEAMASSGQHTG